MKRGPIFKLNKPTTVDDTCDEVEETSLLKKRPRVAYKKLVVPLRMRSIYWKFFGFPADENKRITTKDIIVCTLCRGQMVYNRNTSNLRTHLRCRHKELISKIEKEEGVKNESETTLLSMKNDDVVQSDNIEYSINVLGTEDVSTKTPKSSKEVPTIVVCEEGSTDYQTEDISIIFPSGEELLSFNHGKERNSMDLTEMNDNILNFIVSDLISPDIVDGSGFHRLVSNQSYKNTTIPNEARIISEIIPSIYASAREQVHNSILSGDVTHMSLSMEEWNSKNGIKYMSIYAHYFQSGCVVLTTRLLGTVVCTGINTTEAWGTTIEKLLDEWSINLSAISVVLAAFSSSELTSYLNSKNIIQIPCFVFLMEKLCSEIVLQLPSVVDLLKKCRFTMERARAVQITEKNDEFECNYDEYPARTFDYDSPGLWLTTYQMLHGLLLRKKNILDQSSGAYDCPLISSDWDRLSELREVLEPLQTVVTTFFEEKCPILSLLNPLLWRVTNNVFESMDEDSTFIAEIKEVMRNYLIEAYAENRVRDFTTMATSLDPRFKHFVKENMKVDAKKDLQDALMLLVNTDGLISQPESSSPEKSNSRLSGMKMLFSDLKVKKPALTVQDKIQNEIDYFESEHSARLEECPLQWWESKTAKCPNLFRLARKYLCVPAMVLINGKNSTSDRLKFYHKRANLKVNVVEMLLFLHVNNDS